MIDNNYLILAIIVLIVIIVVIYNSSIVDVFCKQETFKSTSSSKNNNKPSFKNDIRPLFRKIDVESMKWLFDLSRYDDVKKHSDKIYKVVKSGGMPCDNPWDKKKVKLFKKWMDTGFEK